MRAWLRVFVDRKEILWPNINILDFFAGPGTDKCGNPGSPLVILEELSIHSETIRSKGLNLRCFFNERDLEKFALLDALVKAERQRNPPYHLETAKANFKEAFRSKLPALHAASSANLLFLDQTGIMQIDPETFRELISIKRSDFLFFISSSTIKRFGDQASFQKYVKLSKEEIASTPYLAFHRKILEWYKSLVPPGTQYYLAPFSIKKSSGTYGIIFGSGHPLGMEKFLTAAWQIDSMRGEANFDIDAEGIQPDQYDIFSGELPRPKKVELFERELSKKILEREIQTNRDMYFYTITSGFTPSHARKVFRELVQGKKVKKTPLLLRHDVGRGRNPITEIQTV